MKFILIIVLAAWVRIPLNAWTGSGKQSFLRFPAESVPGAKTEKQSGRTVSGNRSQPDDCEKNYYDVDGIPVQSGNNDKRLYRKLGIEEMFELADRNSKSIRTHGIAEKEAAQAVKIARNAALPSIDISLSASYLGDGWIGDRNFSKGMNAPMPHLGNNLALEASQIVYAGGAVSNNIAAAGLQEQIAALDKEKNRQEIRFLLIGNYLELYKLTNQEEVYRKNIEQTERLLADITARQMEGLALKNDITRYELQLKSLELALTRIENGKIILNSRIVSVLGLPEQTLIRVDTCILERLPSLGDEAEWQKASGSSPAIRQAELEVKKSEYGEKLAGADRLPSVTLFAGDRLDGPIIIEVPPINKNFHYWYAGIGVKFNIASAYKSRQNVRLARLSAQKASESEQLLRENMALNVKAAYIYFNESYAVYRTRIKSLELASENYDVIRYRYLNELALITDMLDASNEKLNAELEVANARIDILFNYFKLRKTAGNL